VPAPTPMNILEISKNRAAGSNQKLRLFRRGKAMSGVIKKRGSSQLPKPPIRTGITIKKIIIKACDVKIVLYICSLQKNEPRCPISVRITSERAKPTKPLHTPK
jgi:hypothetical protein